ncbi:MAG: DNA-processing protein DprA [Spirochaetaceae bacterium]|nr:DNA-processing protein DprA [Spirochaetaceae bacterium]
MLLCEKFGSESEFISAGEHEIERICAAARDGKPKQRSNNGEARRWNMKDIAARAEKDAAFMKSRGIRWTSIIESDYPPLLREIYDPPVVLFYRGALPVPEKPAAALVGSRRPSPAAARWAYTAARELSLAGVVVVSGMALGIDSMAHRGCVDAAYADGFGENASFGGAVPTAAVFGSSVDEVYPASNRLLARRIVESGGVLLSEYPPGTIPAKWHFPARNRIISGLCRCVVIVEAGEKSGALITAEFALEQGRDLYVAGGADTFGMGTRKLADEGAKIVRNSREIIAELTAGIE